MSRLVRHETVLLALTFCYSVIVGYLMFVAGYFLFHYPDSEEYVLAANTLHEKGAYPVFLLSPNHPALLAAISNVFVRPPLYPTLIALFYYVYGVEQYVALVVSLAFASLILVVTYYLSARIFSPEVGLLASALVALNPVFLAYGPIDVLTESVFTFFQVAMLLFLYGAANDSKLNFLAAGVCYSLSILTRFNGAYGLLTCLAFMVVFERQRARDFARSLVLFAVGTLVILPYSMWSLSLFGTPFYMPFWGLLSYTDLLVNLGKTLYFVVTSARRDFIASALFSLGILAYVRKERWRSTPLLIFILSYMWFTATTMNADWRRYLLPVIPVFSMVAASQLTVFLDALGKKSAARFHVSSRLVKAVALGAYFLFALSLAAPQFAEFFEGMRGIASYSSAFYGFTSTVFATNPSWYETYYGKPLASVTPLVVLQQDLVYSLPLILIMEVTTIGLLHLTNRNRRNHHLRSE